MTNIYRQGDVLIVEVKEIPAKMQAINSNILAYGEVTGHSHAVQGKVTAFGATQVEFLKVIEPAKVIHQEHLPIALPPGLYRIVRQREYSPEAIRDVRD